MPKTMPKTHKKISGFTLIELLVVITVIGALSGILLGVINSSGVRGKARDSQRIADVKRMQTALELYFADNRAYPVSDASGAEAWEQVDSSSVINTELVSDYINPIPQDPQYSGDVDEDPCDTPGSPRYNYRSVSNGASYYVAAIMEVTSSHDESPCPEQADFCGNGFETIDVCYFAQSP